MSIEVDMNIRPQQQISDERFVVMLKGAGCAGQTAGLRVEKRSTVGDFEWDPLLLLFE